jgi:hypothetical protein
MRTSALVTILYALLALALLGTADLLHAQVVRNANFTLTWQDNSDNEQGFVIYVKEGTNYTEIARVNADVTTYQHNTSGVEGSSVCFAISAYNAVGESVKSNDACASIPSIIPDAPSNVTVTVTVTVTVKP